MLLAKGERDAVCEERESVRERDSTLKLRSDEEADELKVREEVIDGAVELVEIVRTDEIVLDVDCSSEELGLVLEEVRVEDGDRESELLSV